MWEMRGSGGSGFERRRQVDVSVMGRGGVLWMLRLGEAERAQEAFCGCWVWLVLVWLIGGLRGRSVCFGCGGGVGVWCFAFFGESFGREKGGER